MAMTSPPPPPPPPPPPTKAVFTKEELSSAREVISNIESGLQGSTPPEMHKKLALQKVSALLAAIELSDTTASEAPSTN